MELFIFLEIVLLIQILHFQMQFFAKIVKFYFLIML